MAVVDWYTYIFTALGLQNEWARLLFGTALGFAGQLILKPGISYHHGKGGKAKLFIKETYFPWYIVSLIPGVIMFLFF